MEKVTWYINESENTKKIKLNDNNIDYLDERYFVLEGLKLDSKELETLDSEFNKLKNKYEINLKDLDPINLYKTKKDFLIDFFKALKELKIKVLAELIDKKYALSFQIVDNTIRPSLDNHIHYTQWISENFKNEDYKSFLEANQSKSKESFEKYLNDLLKTLDRKEKEFAKMLMPSENLNSPLIRKEYVVRIVEETFEANCLENSTGIIAVRNIRECLKNSIKKYKKTLRKKNKYSHYDFLSIEDQAKNNKIYNHLPHINCFTNLFLRSLPSKKSNNITFIHDNKKEFNERIEENFNLGTKYFKLNKNLNLEFEDQAKNKGLQYSNLIAKTLSNVWIEYVIKNNNDEKIKELYDVITDAVIINLVLPDSIISSNEKANRIVRLFLEKEEDNIAKQNL